MKKGLSNILIGFMMITLLMNWIPSNFVEKKVQASSIQNVTIQVESTKVPNVIAAGDTFTFAFVLKKEGSLSIDSNSVYVDFETTEGLMVGGTTNRMKLKSFNNDGTNTYQAEFKVTPEVAGGTQTITMNFLYQYEEGGVMQEGSNAAKVRIPVNGAQTPTISFLDKVYTKKIQAGEKLTLSYNLKNESSKYSVQNLSVNVVPSAGLSSVQDTGSYVLDTLAVGATSKKELSFQVASDATAAQNITLNYNFDYTIDNQVFHAEGSDIIAISIVSTQTNSNVPYVVVGSYRYGNQVNAGEEFELAVKFKNSSKNYAIQNITITMEATEGLVSQEASNKIFIDALKKSGSTSKTIQLKAKEDVVSGYQTVTFRIKYEYMKDGQKIEAETSEQANIAIKGKSTAESPEKSNVATPYMMVKAYDYGEKVAAGSNFNLHLEIQNTSETVNMENIVVSMETAEDLSITASSNTFYIKKMSAGKVNKKDIELQALASAKAMSATVTLNFKYEYVDKKTRTQVTSTEQISIPIYQPDRLSFELAPLEGGILAGSEAPLSIQYVNKGKGVVYNISAEIEGDAECAEPIQNLGNFEAGANGTIDFYVTPLEVGEVAGQIVVSYEDENMDAKTVEIPYSFIAEENIPMEEGDQFGEGDMPQEGEKNTKSKSIVVVVASILGLAIVLGIVIIIIRKKKKTKKLRLQELEDMKDEEDEL